MNELPPDRLDHLRKLATKLGHYFGNFFILDRALTHCSFANESLVPIKDNERYEFLGDAVLELIVTQLLMDRFPEFPEGELSKIRASAVNKRTLSKLAEKLDLGAYLLLSRGEEQSNGRAKRSILADTYEAVVAAVYLDGGLDAAFNFVTGHFTEIFDHLNTSKFILHDFKTKLQEMVQARYHVTPHYKLIEEIGPDHAKEFVIEVSINGRSLGRGRGHSKKQAEQRAAAQATEALSKTPS